ncbi:MAG: EscU/YscU/HrcU family type III secretion system export apparatus switch protein [Bacillota bacterium]
MANKSQKSRQAAALGYDIEKDDAPRILAKGSGDIAAKILAKAQDEGIPIQTDKDLVQTLMAFELGEEIPEDLYEVVAEILSFIYRLKE